MHASPSCSTYRSRCRLEVRHVCDRARTEMSYGNERKKKKQRKKEVRVSMLCRGERRVFRGLDGSS